MAKGIDYAWGRPGGKKIKNAGFDFVCRYLSNNLTKNITLSEAQDLRANDLKIVLVWESTEQRPLKGLQAGMYDATKSKTLASNIAFPNDKPIYFACDYDFAEAQQPAINEYFKGILSILPLKQVGAYGGYYVLKRLFDANLITYGWQTRAWSGNHWDPRIHIKQIKFDQFLNGVSCDFNESLKDDFGQG